MELILTLTVIVIALLIGLYFYKKPKKKGLDQTDKPPDEIYPLY